MAHLTLLSASFDDGGSIPSIHACDGDGRSPELNWSSVPEEARGLVLIMDDPDAPGGTITHWMVANMAAQNGQLPEGSPPEEALEAGSPVPVEGANDFGETGYGTPCPPPGDDPLRYVSRLFALVRHLDLPPGLDRKALGSALEPGVLEAAAISATYRRGG